MSSPLLWGPSNTSNNLQNQILLANGQMLSNNGPKNYIKNNNFENGLATGWSVFTTTLTNKIPTGSITASAANMQILVTNSTLYNLSGTNSLLLSKTSGDCSSQGLISDAFTIDKEDQAKVLSFKFSYKAFLPSTFDMSGTSNNTWAVYIYDVTNAAWIQPAGVYNLVQSSGIGQATGTFQTSSNGTQYRLALVCINNYIGDGYPLVLDSFFVGPQVTSIAPAMSDFASILTGNVVGTTSGNLAIGTGGGAIYSVQSKRIGDEAIVKYSVRIGTSGTSDVVGAYLFPFPTGQNPASFNTYEVLGYGDITVVSSAAPVARLIAKAFSTGFILDNADNSFLSAGGALYNNANICNITIRYKVAGWSSNTSSSADTDTRVLAARVSGTSTSLVNSTITKLSFNSIVNNQGAIWDSANNRALITVSGTYVVKGNCSINGIANGQGVGANLYFYKNNNNVYEGGPVSKIITTGSDFADWITVNGQTEITAIAGDFIDMRVYQGSGANRTPVLADFSIERLSGPAVVQATETVAADAYLSATTTITTATKVTGWAVNDNSHGAFDTTNSRFIAPVSGRYLATVNLMYNISAFSSSGQLDTSIYKNGTSVGYSRTLIITGTGYINSTVTRVVKLLAGEYLEVFGNKATGTYTVSSHNDANASTFSIVRVGN